MLLLILIVKELISEDLDVFFDLDQQLDLILLNCTSDSWPCEKCVKNLKHSKHFIGILCLR